MDQLEIIMRLVGHYADAASHNNRARIDEAEDEIVEMLKPIIADAQHYRSLQGKIDEQA